MAVFCDELMACAALVRIGPARQSFWAIHLRDRSGGSASERGRTRLLPRAGEVVLETGVPASGGAAETRGRPGRLAIRDGGIVLDLALSEEPGHSVICPNGGERVWTRKQAGVEASGTLRVDGGPPRQVRALAVVDDTAGHHERRTEWYWSAGVGTSQAGEAVAWNLVSGVNDPCEGSERAVWRAGAIREAAPVRFAEDLGELVCEDGSRLAFTAESQRSRRDELLLLASDYRAPFGTFSGELPGRVALAQGLGVMEHHRARW